MAVTCIPISANLIAKALGGSIRFETDKEKGTTLIVLLPTVKREVIGSLEKPPKEDKLAVNDFIVKPFSADLLRKKIDALF